MRKENIEKGNQGVGQSTPKKVVTPFHEKKNARLEGHKHGVN